MLNEAITVFVTLFVIIDPIWLGRVFVALTQGASAGGPPSPASPSPPAS